MYTWDYRGRNDDFGKAFSDKLAKIRGYIRIAGGDSRQLRTRRSISKGRVRGAGH